MKTPAPRIVPLSKYAAFRTNERGACSVTLFLALLGGTALAIGVANGHWSAVGIGLVALGLFLLIGTGIIPHVLAEGLQHPFAVSSPAHAKFGSTAYIILIGEGSTSDPRTHERTPSWIAGSRIVMAAALHRAALASGAKCRIIIAGERTRTDGSLSTGVYARTLADLGVGESEVMQENKGMNTYEYAKNISAIVNEHPVDTIHLVTSALHMKRALLYFDAFKLRPHPFPSDYIHVPRQLLPVGYNFAVADIAIHQHAGIFRFYIYERFGINRRPAPKQN